MIELFLSAFITLFVVIDPIGCAPIYVGLTTHASPQERRATAIRACIIAGLILFGFAIFGRELLDALQIELGAFRIAGGIMLFLIALDMVFELRTQRREQRADAVRADPTIADVAVFPMAMPMLAGPGAIASVMLLQGNASGLVSSFVVFAALGSVLILSLLILLAAGPLMKLMGTRVEAVITRLLGVLLAALAAQFIIDGLRASF